MAEQYTFETNPTALITNTSIDGNLIWTGDDCSPIHYSDNENITLTDTITDDNYETAQEDNTTQYLSVLETTNNITINNISINEDTENAFVPEDLITTDVGETLMSFSVDNNGELIGIRIERDEHGNLQKCEYKFRQNNEGQLEAVRRTVQLITNADEFNLDINNINVEQFHNIETNEVRDDNTIQLYKHEDNSDEHILPDNLAEITQNQNMEDVKVDIIENQSMQLASVKEEILSDQPINYGLMKGETEITGDEHEEDDELGDEPIECEETNINEHFNVVTDEINGEDLIECKDTIYSTENNYGNDENELIQFDTVGNCQSVYINQDEILINDNKNKNLVENIGGIQLNDFNDNHSGFIENFIQESSQIETENYQLMENLHITADIDNGNTIYPELPFINKSLSNINRSIKNTKLVNKKIIINNNNNNNNNKMLVYVIENSEKENLNSLALKNSVIQLNKSPKISPRSILKSSHTTVQENDIYSNEDYINNKRFARGKVAKQCRQFHNFINGTTIPQAPIRKDRLPRKQKINPVQRRDDEIIVEQVTISQIDYIGTEKNKKDFVKVIPTTVILSDSDDSYDPKKANRRKKKLKKVKSKIDEITIDVSDEDEDISFVISDGENDNENSNHDDKTTEDPDDLINSLKRRRGRPPKIIKNPDEIESDTDNELPSKKLRNGNIEDERKSEIPCPKCTKLFASQNSLRTHLQHHNLESNLLRKANKGTVNNLDLKDNENIEKYKCNNCGNNFKNNILLTRHNCTKDNKKLNCTICKKLFKTQFDFNMHKKIHMKQNLCINTVTEPVSPKKIMPPKNTVYKCKHCNKACDSITSLNLHIKTHKEFKCGTCSIAFASKFLLDTHIRQQCVKSPNNKIAKPFTRSSFMKTPILKQGSLRNVNLSKKSDSSSCGNTSKIQFRTRNAQVEPNTLNHKIKIPEKHNLNSKTTTSSLVKAKKLHGGIPLSKRMNKTYSVLKTKLQFSDMA